MQCCHPLPPPAPSHTFTQLLLQLETWSDWRRKTRQKTRATLLLVDRYEDVLTPLMHDFTYQALYFEMPATSPFQVFDYIDSNDEHNDVLLNEDDPVWVRLRHQHIAMAARTCVVAWFV